MEGEGGGGVRILIRGMRSGDYVWDMESSLSNWWMVDLEHGKLQENWYPRVRTWKGWGQMVVAGEKLYLIGGKTEDLDGDSAFVLDTKEEDKTWSHFPLPIPPNGRHPNCCLLGEKIYQLHYSASHAYAYAFAFAFAAKDPSLDFWECRWPPETGGGAVLGRLLADPANNRILVCFYNYCGSYLYAYYPCDHGGGGEMKLIREGDFVWSDAVALVDDVAYVHSLEPSAQLLHALDVSEEGKGRSLDVSWTSTVVEGVFHPDGTRTAIDMCNYGFNALFHAGNNNFWSAYWCPDTYVYFVKFEARRSADKIICTPLHLHIYLLHSDGIFDFALLA